jgi:glycosyltransferase involved in cell wall biosynthesis
MAAGCPVVATRSGGPQSIITHAVDGLLAEVGDVEGLADHVVRLLNDTAFCRELVTRAQQAVSQRYSLHNTLQRLIEIYSEVLEC